MGIGIETRSLCRLGQHRKRDQAIEAMKCRPVAPGEGRRPAGGIHNPAGFQHDGIAAMAQSHPPAIRRPMRVLNTCRGKVLSAGVLGLAQKPAIERPAIQMPAWPLGPHHEIGYRRLFAAPQAAIAVAAAMAAPLQLLIEAEASEQRTQAGCCGFANAKRRPGQ